MPSRRPLLYQIWEVLLQDLAFQYNTAISSAGFLLTTNQPTSWQSFDRCDFDQEAKICISNTAFLISVGIDFNALESAFTKPSYTQYWHENHIHRSVQKKHASITVMNFIGCLIKIMIAGKKVQPISSGVPELSLSHS